MAELRTGLGFDVHPRARGRPLRLGGVAFDGEEGLAGYSDGDAVCHAVADGLLGAAALGDLGDHFPDDDAAVKGIAGPELLSGVVRRVREAGFVPEGADVTVIADRPAIAPARDRMRETLAATLGVPIERVSVKATRPEGLGLSGDGVGCLALVTVRAG
ncbi:MAG TPA: 2-C-methyl-D-erythritol 2,4-cyclodiphosphate synthase [Actinomycetota bacterium]